jgi:hypothetical protein
MSASGRAGQKIRAELKRIEILQRKWNALGAAERAALQRSARISACSFAPTLVRKNRNLEPGTSVI